MKVAIFSVTTLHFIPDDCKHIKVKYWLWLEVII